MDAIPGPRPPRSPTLDTHSAQPQPPPLLRQLWWLGCHSDAGTSTVASLTGLGEDCGILAPRMDFENLPGLGVVLVCRASAKGTWRAQFTLGRYEQLKHRPALVGFVAVAAGPGKTPRIVRERLDLLRQTTRVWQIAWTPEHLIASPDEVGAHPSVQALAADLRQLVAEPVSGVPGAP
jgi:hypothetical protein